METFDSKSVRALLKMQKDFYRKGIPIVFPSV